MKKAIIPFIITVCLLLAAATFFDLRIDTVLYNPGSAFGRFFDKAGKLPVSVLLPFASGFLLGAVLVLFGKLKKIYSAVCLLLAAAASAAALLAVKSYYEDLSGGAPSWALAAAAALIFASGIFSGNKLARKYPSKTLVVALVGVFSLLAANLIVSALKNIWGRRRFFSMTDPAAQFSPWYLPQGKAASDEFKSFPSGHSVSAVSLVWISLFAGFLKKNSAFWAKVIVCFSVIFTLAVMLSRMVLGMHFLSDVTIGAAVFPACFFASLYLAGKYCRYMFKDGLETRA